MSLIIPTLIYIAKRQSLTSFPPAETEDTETVVKLEVLPEADPLQSLPEARPLHSFSAASISYIPELAYEPIEKYYESIKNRISEYDFSKLRIWIVYENILSEYVPSLNEELQELRAKIKDYLSVGCIEINVFALVKNQVRLGYPLQEALQNAARRHLIDYVLVLNNSNLNWVNSGNILRLSEDEFYKYGLRMIEYIHFANIMLDDIAFPFNSLQKYRFYFTISSSFNNFSSNRSQPPEIKINVETSRFHDNVRSCLQDFFANSFKVLRRTNQADIFKFLKESAERKEARQIIFQALQSERKTRDDLLNDIYKRFKQKDLKKIEQTFILLILMSIFQTGLLDQFEEIRNYVASSNNLEKSKEILSRIVNPRVVNNIRELCEDKLRTLRLDEEPLEADAWSEQTDNLWKFQFDKRKHPQLRRIFERNLKIIKDPTRAVFNADTSANISPPQTIEYKDSANPLGYREEDLMPALKHILKMVLKNAFNYTNILFREGFLLLDIPRIKQAASLSDLSEAEAICLQIDKLKEFLQVKDIEKNKFLKNSHSSFEELVTYNLNRSENSNYTPEIMAREVADLLYEALSSSRRTKFEPIKVNPDVKVVEELPAFFRSPFSLSKGISPVLSVIFSGEKLATMNDAVYSIQNIDHQNQKFSLFGPWDEETCFE